MFRLPTVLDAGVQQWMDELYRPEVVFTMGLTGIILRTAVKIAESRDIPIVPYFTDDWISSLYTGVCFRGVLRRSLNRWFHKLLSRSTIRLTVNDTMSEEYRHRYGGSFETMLYAEPERDTANWETKSPTDPARLRFIGSLVSDRWRALRSIGEALPNLIRRASGASS